MGCIITRMRTHAKTTIITAVEYLRNKVLKKDTLQEADRFNKCLYCYMNICECGEPKKPDINNYNPVMSTLHMEPLPLLSIRGEKRQNRNEICQSENIREHTQMYNMQTPT